MYGFAIIKPAYAIRVARASRPEALARAVPFFVLATVCYGSANGESNDGKRKKRLLEVGSLMRVVIQICGNVYYCVNF